MRACSLVRHLCTHRNEYISPGVPPAELKVTVRDSEGERPATGRQPGGQGDRSLLTPGLGLKGGGCFRSYYLLPHTLHPATSPHLPYTASGIPSQTTRRKGCGSQKGVIPLRSKFGSLGTHPGVREGLFGAYSSSIPDQSSLPEGGVRGREDGDFHLPLHLGSQTCQTGRYFLSATWERNSVGHGPQGSGGHKEAQRARKFSTVRSCFPPWDSQSYHVCNQWEDKTIPDPGDPQPPGPGQQGRDCDHQNHCYYINSRAVRE